MVSTEDKDREYFIGSGEYRDLYYVIWSSDLEYADKQALEDTAYNISRHLAGSPVMEMGE